MYGYRYNYGFRTKRLNSPIPDTEAPVVTSFTVAETSSSLTVNILTFSATDNIAVTGYTITETDAEPSTGWVGSAPTTYTFSTEGAKTLYAWAKDSAGNISNYASDTTTITVVEEYPETYSGTIYYVASDGDDGADGSKSTPFATIDKVNTLTLAGNDAVLFESSGTYEGQITVGQSGTTGNPITIGAYGSNTLKPKIYGSELITGWTLHSGNIWKATFATTINQLFVNNVRMQAARFPATGYATVDSAPTTSSLTDADLNGALDYTGVICLIHSSSYGLDKRTVISSSSTTLTLNSAPFGDVTAGEKYILVGKLEFLTVAGQWFYDDVTNTVYLWKTDGIEPTDTEVRGSTLDYGVYADGKDYVTVKNIETLHQKTDGIYFTNSDYFIFDNVTATDNDAVGLHNYLGHHGTIQNSSVSGANWYGIENYASSGNCIINSNIVSDIALPNNLGLSGIGAWYKGSGIYTQNSVTTAYTAGQINTVRYNRVNNVGYNGIHFANEGVVEYNYITNCGYVKNDGGFVYTSGGDAAHTGVNANSIIKHNIGLYGVGIGSSPYFEGMYADEYSENVTIEDNTIGYSTRGVFLHNGNNNIARYNTIFNCDNGLYVSRDGEAVELDNNIVYGLLGQEVIHLNILTGTPIINNNKYINKYTANPFEIDWTTYYTFTNWKSTTGHDALSTFDNVALGAGHTERLIINPTNATKTFYLNAATDVINEATDASLTGSFTIAAYSSVIVTGKNLDCILDYEDAIAPVITAFTLADSIPSFTVTTSVITATGSATAYKLTETDTAPTLEDDGWSITPSYTFTTGGNKTLYAWAIDSAGNISESLSDTTVVTVERIGYFVTPTLASISTARRAMPVTFTEDGTIQSVSVYVNNLGGDMIVGVYADNSNSPGAKIGSAATVTRPSVGGLVEVELSSPVSVTNGQKVWLAVTTENNGLMYEAGSPGRNQSTGLWADGLPDPFGTSTNSAFNYSIYCTYLK